VLGGKVLVSGAAQRTEGQLMVLCYPPTHPEEMKPDVKEMGDEKDAGGEKEMRGGSGGVQGKREEGKAETNQAKREHGPCYRCIFPIPPAPETVQSCAEVGVLGPVVGTIGVLMAMEVVKIIIRCIGPVDGWKPSLLLYSAMCPDARSVFRSVGLRPRRKDCIACGDESALKEKHKSDSRITWSALTSGRIDYEEFCGQVHDLLLLDSDHRVPASQFLDAMEKEEARAQVGRLDARARPLVVDVREEAEWALGTRVKGSVNVPISKILRWGGGSGNRSQKTSPVGGREEDVDADVGLDEAGQIDELFGPGEATNPRPIYFVCQRGNDSQLAAARALKTGLASVRWVGDVRGGFVALEREARLNV
jgi:adenylyltransferase/sulfurtransferase